MIKKLVVLAIIGIVVGIFVYPFIGNITNSQVIADLQNRVQPVLDLVKQNPLIAPLVGAGLTMVGGLVVNYFNNKKLQAKKVQVEALTSQASTNNAIINTLHNEKSQLQQQIQALQSQASEGVTSLSAQLTETQKQLSLKNETIQRLQQDIGTLQNVIADLKMREKVVIK